MNAERVNETGFHLAQEASSERTNRVQSKALLKDLNSYRKAANENVRQAVAKSATDRQRRRLKQLWMVVVGFWALTSVLVLIDLFRANPITIPTLVSMFGSIVMSADLYRNCRKLRLAKEMMICHWELAAESELELIQQTVDEPPVTVELN